MSNDSFAFTQQWNASRSYTANGLNQYTAAGVATPTYDARGNTTNAGSGPIIYSSENLMLSAPGATAMTYDPLGRLYQVTGATTTRFQYIDWEIAAEYDGTSTRLRRYAPGAADDEPAFSYDGSGIGAARWYHADERGSIVAISDTTGAAVQINAYDEYGAPQATNGGRFQYTGQAWLPEIGMYYYKARIYSPRLGRFTQTDPITYLGGMNLYAYVGNDPINALDSSGLAQTCVTIRSDGSGVGEDIFVSAPLVHCQNGPEPETKQFQPKEKKFEPGTATPQKTKHCSGPPAGPPGVSAADLAKQTKTNGDQAAEHSPTDLGWFNDQVRNKGPWDYKQYDRAYQAYGNYNFGYAGARQGIPSPVLRGGAGYAQVRAGTSDLSFITSAFDDPADQEQINRGISDAQNGCY